MPKQVLFIQGAGDGAYAADAQLVNELQRMLGPDYKIIYPTMPNEDESRYDEWKQSIEKQLADVQEPIVVVGHSVGASLLLKCLSETMVKKSIVGLLLMASPFWGGNGWHYEGYEKLELPNDIAAILPHSVPVVFYHCRDDEIVSHEHLRLYSKLLPEATAHLLDMGGHQFKNHLDLIAQNIVDIMRVSE